MGTWHQDQNPQPLWHPTKWTVVDDPPHSCRSVGRFGTREAAERYLDNCIERGAKFVYILNPAPLP